MTTTLARQLADRVLMLAALHHLQVVPGTSRKMSTGASLLLISIQETRACPICMSALNICLAICQFYEHQICKLLKKSLSRKNHSSSPCGQRAAIYFGASAETMASLNTPQHQAQCSSRPYWRLPHLTSTPVASHPRHEQKQGFLAQSL